MKLPFEQLIRMLINEAFGYRMAVVVTFVIISLSLLSVGLVWPKIYTSTTTVLVEEANIINPLMEGTAVSTDVSEQITIAEEVLSSRKVMLAILQEGGWLEDNRTPIEQEQIIESIQKRTSISSVGKNILKIEYSDDTPERAFAVAKKYADLFIAGSAVEKEQESREAFEFIDKQVREYHDKLITVEAKLKEFRSANPDARPGSEEAVGLRINRLLGTVETTRMQIQEEKIKKTSLERQLSGEADLTLSLSREGQLRTRIGELHAELDTLLLTYKESYPDVVRMRQQIEELKVAIVKDKKRRSEAQKLANASGTTFVDEGFSNTPLYRQLRTDLAETKTNVATLATRLEESQKLLDAEIDRSKRIHGGEADMTELTRDYQVNREIYQDLLRRRENARVSMNLNLDRQKTSIRIQEPPVLPVQPSGLRFLHFVIAGIILGFAVPLGVIYGLQQMDPRIRAKAIIVEKLQLPVIAEIPHLSNPAEVQSILANSRWLVITIGGVGLIYLTVSFMKFTGIL